MIPTAHINQQAVATYVREAIWPGKRCFQRVRVSGEKSILGLFKMNYWTSGCFFGGQEKLIFGT
jgi:hypothetical protein